MKFEILADSGDFKIVRILDWDQLCWRCSGTNLILGAQHCQQSPIPKELSPVSLLTCPTHLFTHKSCPHCPLLIDKGK